MTSDYRPGVYLVDRRTHRVGRLMEANGSPYYLLRAPTGGREWECPPSAVRLATERERRAAGIAANGTVRPPPRELSAMARHAAGTGW
ncbi:hypothetical protein LHJ74_28165 [Streptomyces sp. N2-109]|uniref:Integrase n=1 Tax=Streptomyces gossypii TaxID=2883101 RepID=A0ABT2JYM7_9ACTN|nr:hypothetical protein [Streptomyces gossypii]MCT2593002.1 hypothetical protein [Streptomyces gossypii]MCT2593735.1 hypothetical protein [Streptomyces gossypii]